MREQKAEESEESRSRRLEKRRNDGTDEAFALALERCRTWNPKFVIWLCFNLTTILFRLHAMHTFIPFPVFHRPLSDLSIVVNKYHFVSHH
jgi:hypothetical protein